MQNFKIGDKVIDTRYTDNVIGEIVETVGYLTRVTFQNDHGPETFSYNPQYVKYLEVVKE